MGDDGPLVSDPLQTLYTFPNVQAGVYTMTFDGPSGVALTGSQRDGLIFTWVDVSCDLLGSWN